MFSYAEEVSSFDCADFMTSFDITNIPLEETIKICADELSESKTKVNNLTEESFQALLELANLDSFLIFGQKCYNQKNSVNVGSQLGPTLTKLRTAMDVWLF